MLQVTHKLTLHSLPPVRDSANNDGLIAGLVVMFVLLAVILAATITVILVILYCKRMWANTYILYPSYLSWSSCQRRASLLWCAINGVSVKALWRQCFIESTFNFSYVDDRELGNWSKGMPMATMWQCFRVITCKACMHIMIELARHAPCTWTCLCMTACRTQADA